MEGGEPDLIRSKSLRIIYRLTKHRETRSRNSDMRRRTHRVADDAPVFDYQRSHLNFGRKISVHIAREISINEVSNFTAALSTT
jgi:hypothetical protein